MEPRHTVGLLLYYMFLIQIQSPDTWPGIDQEALSEKADFGLDFKDKEEWKSWSVEPGGEP